MKFKYLVIGSNSFSGSHFAQYLISKNECKNECKINIPVKNALADNVNKILKAFSLISKTSLLIKD